MTCETNGKNAAYAILTACQLVSPSGKEQAAFATLHNEMVLSHEPWDVVIVNLANALANGIRYGNWPQQ